MTEKFRYRKKTVYVLVGIIAVSLIVELFLMRENSKALQRSIEIENQAEALKVNTLDIIRNVHLLDLGLRGYAIAQDEKLSAPMDSAFINKPKIFLRVQNSLNFLGYPLNEFNVIREGTDAYFSYVKDLRILLDQGRRDEFLKFFIDDRGYQLWYDHRMFSIKVNNFANKTAKEAKNQYQQAQSNIYQLQIAVLLIVVPTLLYTAFFSNKTVHLAEQLQASEEARNELLSAQNEKLERLVFDRTQEILTQNEEIKSQNEEIVSHNDYLVFQQNQIEKQALQLAQKNEELETIRKAISSKNEILLSEIERQNANLSSANKELLEQNSRLEEFAYIISHNLRAPIARLIGLTSIVNTADPEDMKKVLGMIQTSSKELDSIVKDLTGIVSIQRLSPTLYSHVDLPTLLNKVKTILEHEINDTKTVIHEQLEVKTIFSLAPYLESIFLNVISNAIKYRQEGRSPRITVASRLTGDRVLFTFTDNGIGIDLNKHGGNIFSLYKRFHFHVEGKGLGLFLVKTQIEALGGSVTVNSRIDHGTTFEISLRHLADKA